MLNNDLFDKMVAMHGIKKMTQFSAMLSSMYQFIYLDNPSDCAECEFERDWWEKRYIDLLTKSFK